MDSLEYKRREVDDKKAFGMSNQDNDTVRHCNQTLQRDSAIGNVEFTLEVTGACCTSRGDTDYIVKHRTQEERF